jgi:putative membrane protein
MPDTPHRGADADEVLAAERTALSNERTLLAYTRTALTFGVAGATLLQFFTGGVLVEVAGAACLVIAAGLGGFGIVRFASVRARIRSSRQPATETEEDAED